MRHRVELTARAKADIEQSFAWLAEHSPRHAAVWYDKLIAVIQSLQDKPLRCPLAPESVFFSSPVRLLLYGKRRGIYRILFTVEGRAVRVLHVRHGARRPMRNWED